MCEVPRIGCANQQVGDQDQTLKMIRLMDGLATLPRHSYHDVTRSGGATLSQTASVTRRAQEPGVTPDPRRPSRGVTVQSRRLLSVTAELSVTWQPSPSRAGESHEKAFETTLRQRYVCGLT